MDYYKELIGFDTAKVEGKDRILDYVVGLFKSFNAKFIDAKRGRYIWASFGEGDMKGGLLLSGHLDVVPHDDKNAFELTLKDGLYYGRGTCDMKGFDAIALKFAEMLKDKKLNEPVHFCLTLDEETGMEGVKEAKTLIEKYAPLWGIVGEPTMCEVVGSNLGSLEGVIRVKGIPAHSSEPEKGISAIHVLMDIMNFVKNMKGIVNIGIISGGTAHNILAEDAWFEYQIRLPENDEEAIAAIDDFIAKQPKGKISHVYNSHPPFKDVDSLSKRKVLEFLGKSEADIKHVKFATESGFLQKFGISPVIFGPGSINQAHKIVEYCAKSELEKYSEIMVKIAKSIIKD